MVPFYSRSTVLTHTSTTCFDSLSETSSTNERYSPEDAYMQLCSMKRVGVEVRNRIISVFPAAVFFVKGKMMLEPILAGNGKTATGAQKIENSFQALRCGNFDAGEVPDTVLVALRTHYVIMSRLSSKDENVTKRGAEGQTVSNERGGKGIKGSMNPLICKAAKPICGPLIHQCLTNQGFQTEGWMTPELIAEVRAAIGKTPYMRYYANLIAQLPAGTTITGTEDEGIRLVVWNLLCKPASVMVSCRLAAQGTRITPATFEEILLDSEATSIDKSIVNALASNVRAVTRVNSADRGYTGKCFRTEHMGSFDKLKMEKSGGVTQRTWYFPNAGYSHWTLCSCPLPSSAMRCHPVPSKTEILVRTEDLFLDLEDPRTSHFRRML